MGVSKKRTVLRLPVPKVLVERQDKKIYVWVECELIASFNGQKTNLVGKPLELAQAIVKGFRAVGIEAVLEVSDD